MKKIDAGVIVGRFQCPNLTDGHKALINHVIANHDLVLIFIGVPRTPENMTNPFNYAIREEMVREYVDSLHDPVDFDKTIIVERLNNYRKNEAWSLALDRAIMEHVGPDGTAMMYSGRDGFLPHYSGKHSKCELNLGITCSATEIRETIGKRTSGFNSDMREGIIWAHQNRVHQIYETVDIALLKRFNEQDEDVQILLGQKPGEDRWRFPGGFVDAGEKFVVTAARELQEETGLHCEGGFEIVDDFMLDEWRIRGMKGVGHRTVLCAGWHSWGRAVAGDDLQNVAWWPLSTVVANRETMLMGEHKNLMVKLADWVARKYAIDKALKQSYNIPTRTN